MGNLKAQKSDCDDDHYSSRHTRIEEENDKKHELVTADSKELTEKDLWRPLQPIGTIYFLTHPKKAVYFFLLQKSLMFSWRLARKYFKD